MRPIAIDLFAGVGGLSLGFERAGFDVRAAVEIDPIHCAAHHYNFPECEVIPRSVSDVTGDTIRSLAGLEGIEIDCVVGGAPCQGFSLIGQRALDDPRNSLVKDFVRIVSELDAKSFVFENVKGLTVGQHKGFLAELVQEFEALGYEVRLPWRVLNAGNYGVPQSRERLILMGVKQGLKLPEYPAPVVNIAGKKALDASLPLGPTCLDALGDLPNIENNDELWHTDEATFKFGAPLSDYAKTMRAVSNDSWAFGYQREWSPALLTSSLRTKHSEISQRRFAETMEGTVEPISRFFKLPSQGVSNTLRAGTDSARGAFTSPRPIHYKYARCVTVREMARLHGFPDWFRFHETKWHGARQIGNAVPPPLAQAVAGQMIKALGYKAQRPSEMLTLGDDGLLQMDMSQASRFFGVPNPIGKRDRRSGAKKRKQIDIENERLGLAP